jgi:Putative zinc-finger
MDCAAARTSIFRSLDQELNVWESEQLQIHLAECPSCARQMKLLLLPRRIGRALPAFEPSPFFYQRLRAQLAESQSITIWQVVLGLSRQLVPALAVVTLVLVSVFAYSQLGTTDVDVYQAYDMIFMSGDRPYRMVIADQDDITDEAVLRSIAEDDSPPTFGVESGDRPRN